MWRSLVAHLSGGQGAVGSNPAIPTWELALYQLAVIARPWRRGKAHGQLAATSDRRTFNLGGRPDGPPRGDDPAS